MQFYRALLWCTGILVLAACATHTSKPAPPQTVTHVDLSRYTGTWHEIARYPNTFQRQCGPATATYELQKSGTIAVINRCMTREGLKEARGTAKVVDPLTNARLKVSFFWPFYGDYWILALGDAYDYAVVGTPDRRYLWILSRTPDMDEHLFATLREKCRDLGFDPGRIVKTSMTDPP